MRQPIIGGATTAERSTRGGRRPDAKPRSAGLLRRNAILVSKTPGHEQKLRSLGALSRNGCAVTNVRQEPSLRARLSRLGWRHASLRPATSAPTPRGRRSTQACANACAPSRTRVRSLDRPGASGTPPRAGPTAPGLMLGPMSPHGFERSALPSTTDRASPGGHPAAGWRTAHAATFTGRTTATSTATTTAPPAKPGLVSRHDVKNPRSSDSGALLLVVLLNYCLASPVSPIGTCARCVQFSFDLFDHVL
jgi:hypothetical protein